ncbi:aminotransferase class I/II-fold pyridoxal phosphate-dependent enzyme [Streptomyces sp. YIM 98790]|uniref:MalY/PatB family protein n=1 Tax=Streptomyces sp. YIM 98790 TaxID=2689077 RepID=UPI0028BDC562|nr:aminotransferase class I/II-fold pyridoxal phosphate-dependent enzyme [Streptomyces sp. YIM 98790]
MTHPLFRLTETQLRRRTGAKWQRHPPDVLPLWVAEMDVPLPGPVARALTAAVALGDTGYATGLGYAEAVDAFTVKRWNWPVPPERTAMVADIMTGLVEVVRLLTEPGDTVVISPPVYPPFYGFLRNAGLRVAEAPLDPAGRLDPDALAGAFRRGPAVYVLCSPHNPTGTVHTAEELAELARLAGRHGVRVVADEVHAPLVLPGARFVPYLTVPGAENAFSLLSASKAWQLAGAKAALAVAGPGAGADLARLPEETGHGPSHLGVISHIAAFRHCDDWLDTLLAGLDDNRRLLSRLLAEHLPQVRCRPPEGGYLAWLDCRELDLGGDPAGVFLDRGRVALTDGRSFGAGGAGHVRLAFATPPPLLREAVRRMARAATG